MKMQMDGLGTSTTYRVQVKNAAAARALTLRTTAAAKAAAAKTAADSAQAAADNAAAPGVAVEYLKQQLAAGKALTGEQMNNVVAAIITLPADRIAQIYQAQKQMDTDHGVLAGLAPTSATMMLGSFWTKVRDAVESVAVAPISIFAPNSILAKTVSVGAQKEAITMVRLRDAAESVGSVVANYWVPGASAILSKYVVSKGSQAQLSSNIGKGVQLVTSAAGVYNLATSAPVQQAFSTAKTDLMAKIPTVQSAIASGENAAYTKATQLIDSFVSPGSPAAPAAPSLSTAVPVVATKSSVMPLILGAASLLTLLG